SRRSPSSTASRRGQDDFHRNTTPPPGAVMTDVDDSHDIAVIGLAGRFPGAPNVDAYWRNLQAGVESIVHFSPDELRESGVADETINKPSFVPAWGVLDDAELFDAQFFGYSAREATILDPQQRI